MKKQAILLLSVYKEKLQKAVDNRQYAEAIKIEGAIEAIEMLLIYDKDEYGRD